MEKHIYKKYNLFKNKHSSKFTQNIIILLSYSDGKTPIIEIANKFNIDSFEIVEAVKVLLEKESCYFKTYMKIVFITGDHLRHEYLVSCFSKHFDDVLWVKQKRKKIDNLENYKIDTKVKKYL